MVVDDEGSRLTTAEARKGDWEWVAAGGVVLLQGDQAGLLEPLGGVGDLAGVFDLHTKMVQACGLVAVAFDQDELERGSATAKLAYRSRILAGSVPNSLV
jgi:hypothetical protein